MSVLACLLSRDGFSSVECVLFSGTDVRSVEVACIRAGVRSVRLTSDQSSYVCHLNLNGF
jgi:hypothetical protein